MKTLKNYISESILDDIDTQIKKGDKLIKDEIKSFIKENYLGAAIKISKNPNADGKYEVSSTKHVCKKQGIDLTSLTNGMFIWTTIDGNFRVSVCNSLTSLEGAPKEVGGDFECIGCKALTSLEGAPKKVGGDFYCAICLSLTSLEGAPKEVGGYFDCRGCKTKFTEEDVKKVSNVKGKIIC